VVLPAGSATDQGKRAAGRRCEVTLHSNEKVRLPSFQSFGQGFEQRGEDGSSGRIRTYDPPVNSRMLYR
jgi:hypothetical protein